MKPANPKGIIVKNTPFDEDDIWIIPPYITHIWVTPDDGECILTYKVWGDYYTTHGPIGMMLFKVGVFNPTKSNYEGIESYGCIADIKERIYDMLRPLSKDIAKYTAELITSGHRDIDANVIGEWAYWKLKSQIEELKAECDKALQLEWENHISKK